MSSTRELGTHFLQIAANKNLVQTYPKKQHMRFWYKLISNEQHLRIRYKLIAYSSKQEIGTNLSHKAAHEILVQTYPK